MVTADRNIVMTAVRRISQVVWMRRKGSKEKWGRRLKKKKIKTYIAHAVNLYWMRERMGIASAENEGEVDQ